MLTAYAATDRSGDWSEDWQLSGATAAPANRWPPITQLAQRRAVRDVFVNSVGANVLSQQLQPFVNDEDGKSDTSAAEVFVQSLRESIQPRDAIEEMLVVRRSRESYVLVKLELSTPAARKCWTLSTFPAAS